MQQPLDENTIFASIEEHRKLKQQLSGMNMSEEKRQSLLASINASIKSHQGLLRKVKREAA